MSGIKCNNCGVYDAEKGKAWCVKCNAFCKSDGSPNDQLLEDLAMIKGQANE